MNKIYRISQLILGCVLYVTAIIQMFTPLDEKDCFVMLLIAASSLVFIAAGNEKRS